MQKFIGQRSAYRWVMHFLLAWGCVLALVHVADVMAAEHACESLLSLLHISPQAPASAPVLIRRLVA